VNRIASDTLTIFRREVLRYRRDRAYWIGQLAFPLAVVAFVGFGFKEVVVGSTGADYVGHLASGILVLMVGSGAVGGGFSLIEDRESGFLRALLVAPVARTSIVLGKLAARMLTSLLVVLLLLGILSLFTPLRLMHPGPALLAVVGVTAIFTALGIALASSLRRFESFRLLAAFATVPLYLFSGIFYPISTLRPGMRGLAYANPLSYGVDLFRYGLLGVNELPVALSAGMLTLLGAAAVAVAITVFDRRSRA
jgi:ABC-2 type transport system permease protein